MKKITRRKQKGFVDDFLPMLIFIALSATIIFLLVNTNAAIAKKNTLNNIAREYMLRMESDGYLTANESGSNEQKKLIQELNDAGFYKTNDGGRTKLPVDASCLAGTTYTDFGYGSKLTLHIEVYVDTYYNMTDGGFFTGIFIETPSRMEVTLTTTSKK